MFLASTYSNSSEAARNLLKYSTTIQAEVEQAVDNLWALTFKGGIYTSVCNLGVAFAVAALIFWAIDLARKWFDGDDPFESAQKIMISFVLLLLLAKGGSLSIVVTKGLRGIVNQTTKAIMENAHSELSLQDAYQQVIYNQVAKEQVANLIKQCEATTAPDLKANCLKESAKTAQEIAEAVKSNSVNTFLNDLKENPIQTAYNLAAAPAANVFQTVLIGGLIGLGGGVQLIAEISLLLTGLINPLPIGLSLFPSRGKPIYAWLIGFFSVGLFKLYYNIIVGFTAVLVLQSQWFGDIAFAWIVGILSPLLAACLAAGGGIAVMNGLTSAGQTVVKVGTGV